MLSRKIKFIALASILSMSVLAGTAVMSSYTPNLAKASAPTLLRRAHFAISSNKNDLSTGNLFLNTLDGSNVSEEYKDSFAIDISVITNSNDMKITLNTTKTKFSVANIQSMCLFYAGSINRNAFSVKAQNQTLDIDPSLDNELYPSYRDAAFFANNHFYPLPAPENQGSTIAVYYNLKSLTEDVTEFSIHANTSYLADISNFKGGISFIYGCENR